MNFSRSMRTVESSSNRAPAVVSAPPRRIPSWIPQRLAHEISESTDALWHDRRDDLHARLPNRPRKVVRLETSAHTLAEHVDELIPPPSERSLVWGNALLSTTPTSMAIEDLAIRLVALENAVREIALEVQRLVDQT